MPLYEFAPSFTVDQGDLTLTASGSGVHLNKSVTINLGILDRTSGSIEGNADLLANAYVDNVSVDILNNLGAVEYEDFLTDYKSNVFTFTEYDNINVFGEYTKDFGIRVTVSESSQTHTSEFYFYGNHPEFSGITVQDSTGTTSHSSSQSSKTAVNASGQTGVLTSTITFNNDIAYTNFDRLEIYSSTGSSAFADQINPNPVFSRNLTNQSIQSFDINEGELPNGQPVYLHYVPYGNLGTGAVWTVGPYTFEDNPIATNQYITKDDTGDFGGNQDLSGVLTNGNSAELGFIVGASEITGDLTVGGDIITDSATTIGACGEVLNLKGDFVTLQYCPGISSAETPQTFLQISSAEQVEFFKQGNFSEGYTVPAGKDITIGNAVMQGDSDQSKSSIKYASDNILFSVSGTIDGSSSEFDQSNEINSFASAILLGTKNKIFGDYSTIVAGTENVISGEESDSDTSLNSDFDFIGAGSGNQITGSRYSSIVGGIGNNILKTSDNSFIGGGTGNVLEGSRNSVIGGGVNNYINSAESVQIFGSYITGTSPLDGYIYLADNQNRTKTPDASDTLFIDFEGGVDIKTGDLTVVENITMGGDTVATQDWVTGQGYITSETDDQTLDEVLTQGNVSASGITVGSSTISGDLDVSGALAVINDDTGVSDIFSVDGVNGRLFGVTDEVTGTVFSVNDAAGLPIVEVESTSGYDKITIGEYGSDALVISGTNSAIFNVDVDITGGLDVTGDITMGGETVLTGITSGDITGALGYTPLSSETDDQTLDEVLAQGNTSTRDISVGAITGSALTIDTDTLYVDATNNRVGIRTTSPGSDYALDVNGTVRAGGLIVDTNTLVVDTVNDRIGIGVSSPDEALHVAGNLELGSNFQIGSNGGNYRQRIRTVDSSPSTTNAFNFETRNGAGTDFVTHLTIRNDGNVGIGTTSPSYELDVSGSGHFVNDLIVDEDITMGGNIVLTGITSGDITGALGYTPLSSETDDQTLDEVLTQGNTSTQDISVGAITGSALNITGDVSITGTTTIDNVLVLERSETSYGAGLRFSEAGTKNWELKQDQDGGNNDTLILADGSDSPVVAFEQGGNVGIGVTAPTNYKLQVAGLVQTHNRLRIGAGGDNQNGELRARTIRLSNDTGNSTAKIYSNGAYGRDLIYHAISHNLGYYQNTRLKLNQTEAVFNDDGADVDFRVESDTDSHALFVRGSDGNVGIGTTSPSSKLHVEDSSTSSIRAYNGTKFASIGANSNAAWITAGGNPTHGLRLSAGSNGAMSVYPSRGVAIGEYPTTDPGADNFTVAGSIGIGYTSPSYELDVSGSGHFVNDLIVDEDITMGGNVVLTGITSGDITGALGYTPLSSETDDQTLDEVLTQGNTSSQEITVGGATINGDIDVTGDATITGDFGVGTATPNTKLHIKEDGYGFKLEGLTDGRYIRMRGNGSDALIDAQGQNYLILNNSGNGVKITSGSSTTRLVIGADSEAIYRIGNTLKLRTNNTDRLFISSNGSVGIGVTSFNNSVGFAVDKLYNSFENGSDHITIRPDGKIYTNNSIDIFAQSFTNRGSTSGDVKKITFETTTGSVLANLFEVSTTDTGGGSQYGFRAHYTTAESEKAFRAEFDAFGNNSNYYYHASAAGVEKFSVDQSGDGYFAGDLIVDADLDVTGDITMGGETVLTGITSGDITGALGYTPLSSETDDQTLDEVLAQGNTSSYGIHVNQISGTSLDITTDVTVTGDVEADEFIGDLRGAVSFRAKAGEALSAGDVVYISGIDGNTTVVAKADADDSNKMPAFGVSKETVNANANVRVVNFGSIGSLDTSAYSEGDELFVSDVAGLLTGIAPTGEASALQKMAKVTRSHASSGSITVMGAGRTNAVPNLNEGRLFVGNSSNEAVADGTIHVDIVNSRVGIGTTSPADKLHVLGKTIVQAPDGSNTTLELRNPVNTDRGVRIIGAATSSGSSGVFDIEGFGAGGILRSKMDWGPTSNLTYNLGSSSTVWTTTFTRNVKGRANASQGDLNLRSGHTSSPLTFGIDSTEYMRVHTNGNVGIGTTSPSSILETSSNGSLITVKQSVSGSTFNGVQFKAYSGGINGGLIWNQSTGEIRLNAESSYFPTFYSSGSERMRINSSGNVGIGLTDPTHKLEVSDSGNAISGDNVDISELTLKLRKDNDSNDQGVGLGFSASTTDSNIGAAIVHKRKGSDSYGELHFATKPSGASAGSDIPIRMTINSSGNVGIGTTSPDYELHVIGTASFTDTVAGAYFEENASHESLKSMRTGFILVMDEDGELVPCTKENDTTVFGVAKKGYKQPIIMGAEPIKVTGPIKVGDFITTSNVEGHGMKAENPQFGTIIAQAMESGDGESYNIKAMIRKM